MSREIKFRAWDKKQKRMFDVYGFNRHFVFEESLNDCLETMHKIEDCILLQYSGFKDRKGKEIYEGDILKNDEGKIYVIDFHNGMFTIKNQNFPFYSKYSEIIGNIYENPELLEVLLMRQALISY